MDPEEEMAAMAAQESGMLATADGSQVRTALSPEQVQSLQAEPPPVSPMDYRVLRTTRSAPGRGAVRNLREARQGSAELVAARNVAAGQRAQGLNQTADTMREAGDAQQAQAQWGARQAALVQDRYQRMRDRTYEELKRAEQEYSDARSAIVDRTIDTRRYWRNASEATKVMGWLGVALGAASSSATGGNQAMENISSAVDRDINLQLEEIGREERDVDRQGGLVAQLWERGLQLHEAEAVARDMMWESVEQQIEGLSGRAEAYGTAGGLSDLAAQVQDRRLQELETLQQARIERARRAASPRTRYQMLDPRTGDMVEVTRKEAADFQAERLRSQQDWAETQSSAVYRARLEAEGVTPQQQQFVTRYMERNRVTNSIELGHRQLEAMVSAFSATDASFEGVNSWTALIELMKGGDESSRTPERMRALSNMLHGDSPQGRALRQASKLLLANAVFSMSGKQTNEAEASRISESFIGGMSRPGELIYGLDMYAEQIQSLIGNARGAGANAYAAWERDSGYTGTMEDLVGFRAALRALDAQLPREERSGVVSDNLRGRIAEQVDLVSRNVSLRDLEPVGAGALASDNPGNFTGRGG